MGIFERYRLNRTEKSRQEAVETAESLFQVQEFTGELWLTFGGSLVCPCSMLKDAPVEALKKMRGLYIERNS